MQEPWDRYLTRQLAEAAHRQANRSNKPVEPEPLRLADVVVAVVGGAVVIFLLVLMHSGWWVPVGFLVFGVGRTGWRERQRRRVEHE